MPCGEELHTTVLFLFSFTTSHSSMRCTCPPPTLSERDPDIHTTLITPTH